jgi:hypothetical protein
MYGYSGYFLLLPAKTWVARLLANAEGEIKQLLTDKVISLFAFDPQEAASAKARHDALWRSMTEELEEPQAQANVHPPRR